MQTLSRYNPQNAGQVDKAVYFKEANAIGTIPDRLFTAYHATQGQSKHILLSIVTTRPQSQLLGCQFQELSDTTVHRHPVSSPDGLIISSDLPHTLGYLADRRVNTITTAWTGRPRDCYLDNGYRVVTSVDARSMIALG
ncbi:hypothetical protein ElyMa_003842900 [Elysia marginata]|uniref:Uncharacterized protein n=1 Tax=Elysia marginata TaxID=1093978 RepID=A0AAV4FJH7_9GAST|nr:hypothetical protein ElyMa_003842900 [Elysia marginata]